MYRVSDFLRAANAQRPLLETQLARGRDLITSHDAGRMETESRLAQSLVDVSEALLPRLEEEVLNEARRRTSCPALREDPFESIRQDRTRAAARMTQIEADPLYARRSQLADGADGELIRDQAAALEARAPLRAFIDRAAHPRLEVLLSKGYGTPAYSGHWWQWAYYQDWKAGDEILERFPDHKSFDSLRTAYLQVSEAEAIHAQALRDVESKLDRIRDLSEEHAAAARNAETAEARHLERLRAGLASFLSELPDEVLARVAADSEPLTVLIKRYTGLRAKAGYLDEMRANQLDPMVAQLQTKLDKLNADTARYSTPRMRNVRFRPEVFEQRFRDRTDYYDGYWNRYSRGYTFVREFEDYERMRFTEDLLWWDLMTAGRLDGHLLPSVVEFREVHPEYVFDRGILRDDDDDHIAAAAIAADTDESVPTGDIS